MSREKYEALHEGPPIFRIGAPRGAELPFGEFPLADFGARISEFRAALGAKQQDIARMARVSRLTVIRWESGTSRPSEAVIARLVENMSEIYGYWVINSARFNRPSVNELRSMGFEEPASDEDFHIGAAMDVAIESEIWNAVSLFGGYVTATRDDWEASYYLDHRALEKVPIAYDLNGAQYLWGFDIGHLLEARSLGRTYKTHLGAKAINRRVRNADIAELRLVAESRYRLSWNDLVTRKLPLTNEERDQYDEMKFIELPALRPRVFPQDIPRVTPPPQSNFMSTPEWKAAVKKMFDEVRRPDETNPKPPED